VNIMSQPQEQLLPRRVLIVDDDELVRESLSALLRAADFEVDVAPDGEAALTLLGRQWFPVVVTDRAMPVLDGIEFVSRLRAVAIAPAYVIMLTSISDSHDFECGYCAGVDLYIVKKDHERELAAKVATAFGAVRRRQTAHVSTADRPITVDLESGAHTARHLVGRLHAEMSHAARTSRALHVISVSIEPDRSSAVRSGISVSTASEALLQAVHAAVRHKLDWVARLPAGRDSCRLAIIMPEADDAQIAAVEQGVRNAFVTSAEGPALRGLQLTFGAASLSEVGEKPTALGLLAEAERHRRGVQAKVAPAGDVKNIQEGEAA
jgi:DNA-binding response OmpR family regulator